MTPATAPRRAEVAITTTTASSPTGTNHGSSHLGIAPMLPAARLARQAVAQFAEGGGADQFATLAGGAGTGAGGSEGSSPIESQAA